jgi:hypothetical protein
MNIIVGGGKYGCQAVEYLRSIKQAFTLVDITDNCLAVNRYGFAHNNNEENSGEHFVKGGLGTVLMLISQLKPEYVFPTAPTHLAAELAEMKFSLEPWDEAINLILPRLPSSVVLKSGRGKLIVSYNRDRNCVEKCVAPETCPSTGIKRPCSMSLLMKFACPEAYMLISHQVAPGMGALKGSELSEFFEWAEKKNRFIVATACDCHGVFSAYTKLDRRHKEESSR